MGKGRAFLTRLAACVLLFAIVIAPLTSALTHGPGQIAMAGDHAAWHAGQHDPAQASAAPYPHDGAQSSDHDHPAATDHDHSPTVILPKGGDLHLPPRSRTGTAQADPLSGTIRDGPLRPPRLT